MFLTLVEWFLVVLSRPSLYTIFCDAFARKYFGNCCRLERWWYFFLFLLLIPIFETLSPLFDFLFFFFNYISGRNEGTKILKFKITNWSRSSAFCSQRLTRFSSNTIGRFSTLISDVILLWDQESGKHREELVQNKFIRFPSWTKCCCMRQTQKLKVYLLIDIRNLIKNHRVWYERVGT